MNEIRRSKCVFGGFFSHHRSSYRPFPNQNEEMEMKEEFRADKELVGDGWRGAGRKSRIWICPCLEKDTKANTSQPPHAYTPTH